MCLLANLRQVQDMHTGGLAAGTERDVSWGGNLPRVAKGRIGRCKRRLVPGTWAVSAGSLCLGALQAERGSLAGASAWSRSDGVRSFCLPGGGFVPAPQRSGRSRMVSSLGLVLSLLSRGSGLLPGKRGFLFKIQYFQGLVTANRQDLLSWVSTLNFDCAAEHLWTSSEPVFTGTHMHPCTYATPINRKNTQYKHIHTQSHMDTCSLIETRPMYWISLLASKSWPICQYLRDARLDHFHCLSLKSCKLFCWPLALAPIFLEK